MQPVMTSAYAKAGVDTTRARDATSGLVDILRATNLDRPPRAVLASGHYANVLSVAPNLGIAVSMDGVGSKAIVAEMLGRFDTIGIDCIAMNVNDVICVGAEPIALLDYISIQDPAPEVLRALAEGLRQGAEDAAIEIAGGEVAQLPEMLQGHPDNGFDLVGTCFGIVPLGRLLAGDEIRPGDAILGIPSSGVHANGLTLARRVLDDLSERPVSLGGRSVGETLLEPTVIYVRAIAELRNSGLDIRGLAHITSDSFRNLLRLNEDVGYRIDALSRIPIPPIFELIGARGRVASADMFEVFNMGCGFCCVVAEEDAETARRHLDRHHPGTARIGTVTAEAGQVELSEHGLYGTRSEAFHVQSETAARKH
jgi:phosphoribosylformylglycinamidine cyclo-ligase